MTPISQQKIAARVARARDDVLGLASRAERLAREIHRDPELGCREVHAVTRLAGELEEEGFDVETGVGGLPTALRARFGSSDRCVVALLAEYDAVPGLGHAAGHNLIVANAYCAAVAAARAAAELDASVMVFGAPAEETIGGKVVLAERGVYDGVHAALLAHPASEDRSVVRSLASWSVEVTFEGRAAHAVAAPEKGINALDAMIQLFVARDALLKALDPAVRCPGVILEGGVRPNLVPSRSRARFSLRASDSRYLVETVHARFCEVVQGVARSTGTTASVVPVDNLYDEIVVNDVLAERYEDHARQVGLAPTRQAERPVGSLDVGTLSHRVPCLHPLYPVCATPTPAYTPEFARIAASDEAMAATMRAAQATAMLAVELMADAALFESVRAAHLATPRPRPEGPLITEPVAS